MKTFHQTVSVFIFRLKYVCRDELQHIKSSSFSIKHLTVQASSCHSQKKRFLLSISISTVKMFHQTVSVFKFRLKYVCRGELQHIKSSSFSIKHLTVQAISCHSQKKFLLSISSSTVKMFHQTVSVSIFRLKYVCRGELQHIKSSSFSIKHLTVQTISCHSQKKDFYSQSRVRQ